MATLTAEDQRRTGQKLLVTIIAICTVIEVSLKVADWGIIDAPRLRQTVYEYGGFWPGLLRNWIPNFPGQSISMFVTYGFLHGGLAHLIVNMMTLWSLGEAVINRVKLFGFVLLYSSALIGGAIGYHLLGAGLTPMVGASGALFGLAGGLLAWSYVDRFTNQQGLWPIAQAMVLLIALNLVLWYAMDGKLAWETHLGGFVSGWLIALVIDPRAKKT